MCGIAGFSLNPSEGLDANRLARSLLLAIEVRGRHATGAAWRDTENRKVHITKRPIPATAFNARGHLDRMPDSTTLAILHTRWATKGSPTNPANNHPIVSGKIVGVHNGHLDNDDALFKRYGGDRRGQVDSEAAFHVLDRTALQPEQVLDRLEGRAALAWIDRRTDGTLHLARVTDSPLAIAQTAAGSTIFASTAILLRQAANEAGIALEWIEELPEWSYLRVNNGVISDYRAIVGKAA